MEATVSDDLRDRWNAWQLNIKRKNVRTKSLI